MTNLPGENFLQVEGVDIGSGEKRSVLKPLNSEGIIKAINQLKAKIDPSQHDEVDAAVNQAMGRFVDKRYSTAFAGTVGTLNDALKQASAGETVRLASILGLTHITREGSLAQAQNLGQIGQARIGEAEERAQAAAQAQAEAMRKTREQAEAARLAQQQAQQQAQASGRLGALREFLGGQSGTKTPLTEIAKK